LPAAVVVIVVAIGFLVQRMQPLPLDDDDLAALVRSKELGFPAKPEDEVMEKSRTFNGAIKVHYHARALGSRQRSSVDQVNMTYPDSVHAAIGFEGMKIGGTSAFALAADKNESMVARDIDYAWADHTYWADYRVGEASAGAFVVVQTGSVVHFISLNGMTVNTNRFEPILRAHWQPVP
jgi:hypothetical protein